MDRSEGAPIVEDVWPAAGESLLRELVASPGRFGLIVEDASRSLAAVFAALLAIPPISVGGVVTAGSPPSTIDDLVSALSGARILVDLDVLFWQPWLSLDPPALLRTLARRDGPVIAEWPGNVNGRIVTYSVPGRSDYYRASLEDAVLLRPCDRVYPDEVPYTVERI